MTASYYQTDRLMLKSIWQRLPYLKNIVSFIVRNFVTIFIYWISAGEDIDSPF
jgi:hypothetical protein